MDRRLPHVHELGALFLPNSGVPSHRSTDRGRAWPGELALLMLMSVLLTEKFRLVWQPGSFRQLFCLLRC